MRIHQVLLAAATLILAPLQAADPIGINALAANAGDFAGKEITVTGHIDRVSAARRMVVLIDTSEATCKDGCNRKTLLVELPAESPLPAKGQTLVATGKLTAETGALRFSATRAETAP